MDFDHDLNEQQEKAVKTTKQYVRVVAGAGSGKTRVLTYRLAYLIAKMNASPSFILAITFTNKASREMNERATNLVREVTGFTPRLNIFTFHAFCARLLRMEHEALEYPANFTILDEEGRSKLIKNCAVELGYKKGDDIVKQAAKFIDKKKGQGKYPWDYKIEWESFSGERTCQKIYELYEQRKGESYCFDFDDLLLKTVLLLDLDPSVQERWKGKYSHILVDEFQDTDPVQYKLLELLSAKETSLYVVGDPDQTIYTWRGASQKIILDFTKEHQDAETIILNENYRSTKNILEVANRLIAKNKNRVPKDLFTNAEEGAKIECCFQPNAEDEAEWVAKRIVDLAKEKMTREGKPDYSSIAILYRSSYMTRTFEAALKDRGIPYRIFGGLRFYERMEVKDVLAYCTLMVNPKDDIAFERIANRPRRAVGEASIDYLRKEAHEKKISEYEFILQGNYEDSSVPKRALRLLRDMSISIEEAKKKLEERVEAFSSILRSFLKEIGYMDYLQNEEDVEEDRIGNVNALFTDIDNFLTKHPDSTFEDYLQNVSLLISGQDDMSDGNFVSMMTIHVAKGLEFDNVFIIFMNQGAFPNQRAISERKEGEEEERRLAYVAFTRARKRLYLSGNGSYSYSTGDNSYPSSYFKEAGINLPKTPYMDLENRYFGEKRRGRSYFSDGEHISPFTEKKKEPAPTLHEKTPTNGITNWQEGEKLHHDKFGDGVVVKVITSTIIAVKFEEGIKTIIGNNVQVHRIHEKGEEA